MSKSVKHTMSSRQPVILLSSLITALAILLSGLLWMILSTNRIDTNQFAALPESESAKTVESEPDHSLSVDSHTTAILASASSQPESQPETRLTADTAPTKSARSTPQKKSKVVKKSKKADSSYLDDAVFIGDSISVSLSLYKALPAKNVIATQNVSLYQVISGKECFATPKGKVNLKTAMKGKKPKKIYVMLGANGMNGWSNKKQIGYYKTLLDQLEKDYPNAIIYVESMTPVTASRNKTDKNINNTKIKDYNKKLLKLVESRGDNVYYLDLYEGLQTKYGNLKSAYNGGDGLHFSPAAARAVVDYALTHTVPEKSKAKP